MIDFFARAVEPQRDFVQAVAGDNAIFLLGIDARARGSRRGLARTSKKAVDAEAALGFDSGLLDDFTSAASGQVDHRAGPHAVGD